MTLRVENLAELDPGKRGRFHLVGERIVHEYIVIDGAEHAALRNFLSGDDQRRDLAEPVATRRTRVRNIVRDTDARMTFGNYGPCLDMYAPGAAITTTWYTNDTATITLSGSSFAAAHVAGCLPQEPDSTYPPGPHPGLIARATGDSFAAREHERADGDGARDRH
jgi:hypothetical protein